MVDGDGRGTLRLGGSFGFFGNSFGRGSYQLRPAELCIPLVGETFGTAEHHEYAEGEPDVPACADATTAIFDESGELHRLGISIATGFASSSGAPFVRSDGGVTAFARRTDRHDDQLFTFALPTDDAGLAEGSSLGSVDLPWRGVGHVHYVLTPNATDDHDEVALAVAFGSRVAFLPATATTGQQTSHVFELGGSLPGTTLSARLDPAGRTYLATTHDGGVRRVEIGAAGFAQFQLADLDLPEGDELVTAFPHQGGLLVITQRGREDFEGGALRPVFGTLHAFTAAVDPTRRDRPLDTRPHDIATFRTGTDMRVCYSTATPSPGLSGFTLGGFPAEAVKLDDHCVLLLRERATMDLDAVDAWLVEGPIPGVGRVSIASVSEPREPLRETEAWKRVAPLAGGGFASLSLRYGNGMTPIGTPARPLPLSTNIIETGLPDAGGLGIWQANRAGDPPVTCPDEIPSCQILRNVSDTYTEVLVPSGTSAAVKVQLRGGGVLWEGGGPAGAVFALVDPDYEVTVLPDIDGAFATSYVAGDADGAAFGIKTTRIGSSTYTYRRFRRAPDGAVTEGPEDDGSSEQPWIPGPDGFYGYGSEPTDAGFLWYVDPATLEREPVVLATGVVPANRTVTPVWDGRGTLFMHFFDATAKKTTAVVELRGSEAVNVSLPAAAYEAGVGDRLFVDDLFFTFVSTGLEPEKTLRIPR
ncbi:MAG: hypothetical protein H6724_04550 [Sandaracinus sp.]|nr:hypothetical protein [Sandaracinus sp.]